MKPIDVSQTGGGFGRPPVKSNKKPDVEDKALRGPKEQDEPKPAEKEEDPEG